MNKKSIIIIDDQKLFAEGIKQLLEQNNDIVVEKIINKGANALYAIKKYKPDAILLDLNMPDKTGFEVLEEIRDKFSDLPVCILSTYDNNAFIEKAKSLKANAYFSKDASIDELRQFIFQDYDNDFLLSENIQIRTKLTKTGFDNFVEVMQLTEREIEIIKLIAKGYATKEIADNLFISDSTVKTHRKNIFKKLNINNVSELLKIVYEYKIL